MKMKKVLALVLAGAMTFSLAACGGGGSESGEGSGEEKTVVYWSMWQETEPQAEILKAAIDRFEEANENVTVEVEWQGRGVKDLVSAAIAAGEKIDVFDTDPMVIYQTDPSILMDLTDLYESESLDGDATVNETIMAGLIEWDKALSADYSDGKNYSVPYNPYCIDFFYNTEHFEDAGIEKVPETWAELDEACAKLKEAGYEPIVMDDAYSNMIFAYYLERLVGEDAVKEMRDETGFANDAVMQTLKALEDFASKGYFAESCETNKFPAGQQQFARREASMYFNASFMASENAETAGEDFPYGHFPFPTVEGGTSDLTANSIGGQAFMVNANTDVKDEAYELIRHFAGKETQEDFLAHGLTTAHADVAWPEELAGQMPIVESTKTTVNWGASFDGEFATSVVQPAEFDVVLGNKTAEEAYKVIEDASK